MRYLEVGSNFKYPKFPIWVFGSATHYTCLFSFDATVREAYLIFIFMIILKDLNLKVLGFFQYQQCSLNSLCAILYSHFDYMKNT
jgi:hypothetical protein